MNAEIIKLQAKKISNLRKDLEGNKSFRNIGLMCAEILYLLDSGNEKQEIDQKCEDLYKEAEGYNNSVENLSMKKNVRDFSTLIKKLPSSDYKIYLNILKDIMPDYLDYFLSFADYDETTAPPPPPEPVRPLVEFKTLFGSYGYKFHTNSNSVNFEFEIKVSKSFSATAKFVLRSPSGKEYQKTVTSVLKPEQIRYNLNNFQFYPNNEVGEWCLSVYVNGESCGYYTIDLKRNTPPTPNPTPKPPKKDKNSDTILGCGCLVVFAIIIFIMVRGCLGGCSSGDYSNNTAEEITYSYFVIGDNVGLRDGISSNAKVITSLDYGDKVSSKNELDGTKNYLWVWSSSNKSGYIRPLYLVESEDFYILAKAVPNGEKISSIINNGPNRLAAIDALKFLRNEGITSCTIPAAGKTVNNNEYVFTIFTGNETYTFVYGFDSNKYPERLYYGRYRDSKPQGIRSVTYKNGRYDVKLIPL